MRTENSIKNISISIFSQVITVLLGLFSRKVFINNLGIDYLGVNGLLSNILSMLALVEGGIGTSIIFNLYKPLAEKNEDKVIALVQLYKKIYQVIALLILMLSICIFPIVLTLINRDTSVANVSIIYFIFVFNNIITYFNAHKWSLINADQRGYILVKYNLIFSIATTVCKIFILSLTQNYILFLVIEGVIFIFQNIWNGRIVDKLYPYIKRKDKVTIDSTTKKNLITNVKAIFLHNVGGYCVYGTDNLLISYFINIKTVGLYSNYTMIINQLSDLMMPILNGIGASVGNLIATESSEKNYEVFNVVYFINFWIFSFCTIFLFNLLEPFIELYFGRGLLVDKLTFIVVLLNFYLKGMRSSVAIFKTKAGIFARDKFVPLIEAAINLGASLFLVKYMGLAGIFIGTTISTIALPFWTFPTLVYINVLKKPVKEYFVKYIYYGILTISICCITTIICNLMKGLSLYILIIKGLICCFVPNVLLLLIFYRTKEFQYLLELLRGIVSKLKYKIVKKAFKVF